MTLVECSANALDMHADSAYSKSKGLYAGVSLEGTGLVERVETNAAFYGTRIPAADLLS